MNLGFLSEDWNKLPQNFRYFILAGGFLIFNSWLLDHWGQGGERYLKSFDFAYWGYWLGLLIIILGIFVLIIKQFTGYANIIWLRRKYPISKLNKDFYIYSFNGKWMLYDKKTLEYFHIHPWETVVDLRWQGWENGLPLDFQPENKPQIPIGKTTKLLDTGKYKYGGSINTSA